MYDHVNALLREAQAFLDEELSSTFPTQVKHDSGPTTFGKSSTDAFSKLSGTNTIAGSVKASVTKSVSNAKALSQGKVGESVAESMISRIADGVDVNRILESRGYRPAGVIGDSRLYEHPNGDVADVRGRRWSIQNAHSVTSGTARDLQEHLHDRHRLW